MRRFGFGSGKGRDQGGEANPQPPASWQSGAEPSTQADSSVPPPGQGQSGSEQWIPSQEPPAQPAWASGAAPPQGPGAGAQGPGAAQGEEPAPLAPASDASAAARTSDPSGAEADPDLDWETPVRHTGAGSAAGGAAAGGAAALGATAATGGDAPAPAQAAATSASSEAPTTVSAASQRGGDGSQERGHGEGSPGRGDAESSSRVSVVDESPPRPAPPDGASEEEYRWHTYKVYPSGRPDAVEFIDTYKAFGRNRILRGLNMGLPEGMVSMILGPSGTGKSVCIKHMVGLLYPDQGDVLVHGQSVPNMPDDDLFDMRKKFGLLFQDGALFGSMNLYDNVAFPLRQHTEKGEDEVEDIVMRRLTEVGLADAREKMPNELSGGMRKRAGFARALVLEPDIVLFDEPDSGLDPVRTALLGELILEIHRDMMEDAKKAQKQHLPTFAVITHDIMSARRVADYINVLWKGRIVEAGPAEDMLNSENPFIRQFLAGESQGPLTMD
jgi:phospholipid/cholesterol/gamma-HCH transport system ATP-binding protein